MCMKIYIITSMLVRKNGLRFVNERTTHQNIVAYGSDDAKNIY